MSTESGKISRAFYITFGVALVLECIFLALSLLKLYLTPDSTVAAIWFLVRYAPLIAFGFMIGQIKQPYRAALVNACVFALLWFVFGYFTLTQGADPGSFTVEQIRLARWGYVMASLLFLPLALLAASFGVWLARRNGSATAA